MTTQEIETREEREENRLSTADLAAANDTTSGSALTIAKAAQEPNLPLFAQNDTQDFRSRWEKIQSGFVDEPRTAVVQACLLYTSPQQNLWGDSGSGSRPKL